MNEAKKERMKPEEELVDLLLDFIIVSANLAKNIYTVIRHRQLREGGCPHEAVRGESEHRRACHDARA